MKATNKIIGTTIGLHNVYTGRVSYRTVTAVSKLGNKITVERKDWLTGVEELFYRPTDKSYYNEYTAEIFHAQ
jgi:hypothetical protein